MKSKTKQPHIWQIDDDVYFIDETECPGQIPGITRGTVEEIKRDALRVRTAPGEYSLLWVDRDACYSEADDLYEVLKTHMERQFKKLKRGNSNDAN